MLRNKTGSRRAELTRGMDLDNERGCTLVSQMEKNRIPMGWRYLGTVADGQEIKIEGINVWQNQWVDTGRRISVKDPLYDQSFTFSVYEMITPRTRVIFAAGASPSAMWGFY